MALKDDGNIAVISRCIEGDDGFHVVGELVVALERVLNHVHIQLKRAIEACGDHPVFIISPWPRFIRTPCCSDAAHVTNFNNADFLSTILGDLNKHKSLLRRAVPAATIIDGLELIFGTGYNTEKAAAVINSGWAFDPVHPGKHAYAKMALNLLEKIAPQNQHRSEDRKRSWSFSNSGGSGGGDSGSGCSNRSGGHSGAGTSGGGGRQTVRSQQWKQGSRRDSFRSTYSNSSDDGNAYSRQHNDGRPFRGRGGGECGRGYQHYGQNRGGFGGGRGGRGGRGGIWVRGQILDCSMCI